jgi:tRNA (guanine-N7-)-methyltransferase
VFANSRQVASAQQTPHARLEEIVRRHLSVPYRRRPSNAGREAFSEIKERIGSRRWMLDAGCGTGESTCEIARRFPDHVVVGIDKSAARLGKNLDSIKPANAILVRCDCVDFWQLAAAEKMQCDRQFLLYPNPWPKPDHVKRRWHAHPIFPALLAVGGALELRTNWRIYAEEFGIALKVAGIDAMFSSVDGADSLTPFERKYQASGHSIYRLDAFSSSADF